MKMNDREKSIWERHRDRRFKEVAERFKNWGKIRKEAFKKHGVL